MCSNKEIFQKYVSLEGKLNEVFIGQQEELVRGESTFQLTFSIKISDLKWAKEKLPILMGTLISIPFRLTSKIRINDCFDEEFLMRGSASELFFEWINPDISKDIYYGSLPASSTDIYNELWAKLKDDSTIYPFSDIYDLLIRLNTNGAEVILQLTLIINKKRINEEFKLNNKNDFQTIICFIFSESLLSVLSSISLDTFERDFYTHGRRIVIPLFGFSGYLRGDFLTICGYDYVNKLDAEFAAPLSDELLSKANKSLNLRQYHSLGTFPTKSLTPDVFHISISDGNDVMDKILIQLDSFKAFLSALFLADYTELINNGYRIEYIGRGQVSFPLERAVLLENQNYLDDIYKLYTYSYDGFSADKLEIAQQFLSLSATDVTSLCKRATAIRDATKIAYDNVLVGKVRDFFEARQKIQEIIKTAISETSNSLIGLTRDVSKDLYTIAGVIAIAIVGILLKPDFDLRNASLAVSLVIAAYMGLIILYHLNTLKQAHNLQMGQRKAYIKSFEAVLGAHEIESFLADKQLNDISALFDKTLEYAYLIYVSFLAISLFIAVINI